MNGLFGTFGNKRTRRWVVGSVPAWAAASGLVSLRDGSAARRDQLSDEVAATRSGSVSVTGARATYTWNSGTNRMYGTVYDTEADSACAYGYVRGRNIFLGWSDWKLKATVCGKGQKKSYSEIFQLYADNTELRICRGAGTSNCKVVKVS